MLLVEPVLRELHLRIDWSGGTMWQGGYYFSLLGHGGIKLVSTRRTLPDQSGALYAVEPMLRQGPELEFVMLDLATAGGYADAGNWDAEGLRLKDKYSAAEKPAPALAAGDHLGSPLG